MEKDKRMLWPTIGLTAVSVLLIFSSDGHSILNLVGFIGSCVGFANLCLMFDLDF